MKQLTLTDLQKKPRQATQQEALGKWLAYPYPDTQIDERIGQALCRWLTLQDGTSVLDLCCGKASITLNFGGAVYYEGIDIDAQLLAVNQGIFPEGRFTTWDLKELTHVEPTKRFNLVLVHPPYPDPRFPVADDHCLVNPHDDQTTRIRDIAVNLALKSLTDEGVMLLFTPYPDPYMLEADFWDKDAAFWHFLRDNTRLLLGALIEEAGLVVYAFRQGKPREPMPEKGIFQTITDFEQYLASLPPERVPVSSGDPRPFQTASWNIQLMPAKPFKRENLIVRSGKRIGWQFKDAISALSWAGKVLDIDRLNPWLKAVERVQNQFDFANYLRLKESQRPLWDICLLTPQIAIAEEPNFARFLNRYGKQLKQQQTAYPDNTPLEGKYWTLAPGDLVEQAGKLFEIKHVVVDLEEKVPPKLILAEQQ